MGISISSLSTGGASMLNSELITNLKEAETTSRTSPIQKKLSDLASNISISQSMNSLFNTFKESLDLFNINNKENAFKEMSATTEGEAVLFDVVDFEKLTEDEINISVEKLATRDVFQSDKFSDKTALLSAGTLDFEINGQTLSIDTTDKSMEDIMAEINDSGIGVRATIEQVSSSDYRMVLKSQEPGYDNSISITQTGIDLGLENVDNHVLEASNMVATIDGVEYNVASNSVNLSNGIRITPVSLGDSSIKLEKDVNFILDSFKDVVDSYNALVDGITNLKGESSTVIDSSVFEDMLSIIKEQIFENPELFKMGISFDDTGNGKLVLDENKFNTALETDYDNVMNTLLGTDTDNPGVGTLMFNIIDEATGDNGYLSKYVSSLQDKTDKLTEEQEKMLESIDIKYTSLQSQFTAYASIITQMESSFAGLKQMIDFQAAGN